MTFLGNWMARNVHAKESSSRLRKALFLYMATALLVLMLALALTISLTLFNQLKKAEDKSIVHTAQTRATAIAEWCRRAKDLARQITSRTSIRQELEQYNKGDVSLAALKAYSEPKLQDAMDLSKEISGILRLDVKGRPVAACGNGSDLTIAKKDADEYILDDIALLNPHTVNGRSVIVVSAPIRNRAGERQGTDLVLLDMSGLKAIVSPSKPSGGLSNTIIGYQSDEALACLFSETSGTNDALKGLDSPNALKTILSKAIAGRTGIENISDTLMAYASIAESGWGLVIVQDENELYGPLYRKMAYIGILFLLIYFFILFGFGFVMKPLAGRILMHADDLGRKIKEKTAVLEKEIARRTEIEKRLRESEQFLASVFDSIQDGIGVLSPDLKIVRTNKTMQAWFGQHIPLEGKACFEAFQCRDQACADCPALRCMESRKLEMKEVDLTQGGGETRVLEVYAFPRFDDDGAVAGIVEYVRDISGQKQAEQVKLDLRRRLETAQHLAKSGWWEYDVRNDVVIWPEETYALYGLDSEGAVLDYNRLLAQIHPDYHDYHNKQLEVIYRKGTAEFQYPIKWPDGEQRWIWAKGEAEYDEKGEPIRLFGTLQDITERKRAQRALADSQRRLTDIIEFLPDPTFVINTDGQVIAWNRAMERMTGIEKKEMMGKGEYAYAVPFYGSPRPMLIDLALKPDASWEESYLTLKKEDGQLFVAESFNPAMAGGERYLAPTASRLYDARGNVVGAIETVRDITDAKRTEQEREQLITELKKAIAQVNTLSGLLPMCASCKKVRDDRGYWSQLEIYIHQHTNANISHSLCPDCAEKMYGGQEWYEKGKEKRDPPV